MKKTIAIILSLIIVMTVVLAGCGNSASNTNTNNDSNDVETTVEETEEETTEPPTEALVNSYEEYNDFSDGLAWVKYNNSNGDYYGCIDKTGKMKFKFSASGVNEVTNYSGGYAFMISNSKVDVVNTSGEITYTYEINDDNKVLSYGEGYMWTREYKADFDSVTYTHSMRKPDGTVLDSIETNDTKDYYSFDYFGKGTFGYYLSPWEWHIYQETTGKWFDYTIGNNGTFYFYEDIARISTIWSNDVSLQFLDLEGNRTPVALPSEGYGQIGKEGPVSDNMCVFAIGYEDTVGSYNLDTKKFAKLPDKYTNKIIFDDLEYPLAFNSGRIALKLMGSDKKKYVAVFDKEWNTILEPIEAESYIGFGDERTIIKTSTDTLVYDIEGNVAFNASDLGYSEIQKYSDGVARVADQYEPTYLDKDGKVLFDAIDDSTSY